MAAESAQLPFRKDWDTCCVPSDAVLGPHPALAAGGAAALPPLPTTAAEPAGGGVPARLPAAARRLQGFWLGGACWLGFLAPAQLRALHHHYAPLSFVASEGPLPDTLPLDGTRLALLTMLRQPLDRTLSSYHWWRFMLQAMPQAPGGACSWLHGMQAWPANRCAPVSPIATKINF